MTTSRTFTQIIVIIYVKYQDMHISVLGFKFHNFNDLPLDGQYISPNSVMSASGDWIEGESWAKDGSPYRAWRLLLCPNDPTDEDPEAMLSFRIDKDEREEEDDEVEVDMQNDKATFTIVLRRNDGTVFQETFTERFLSDFHMKGFIERRKILDKDNNILGANDSLKVELIIQPGQKLEFETQVGCPLVKQMLQLFDNAQMIDICFDVDGSLIFAHRFVLKVMAPEILSTLTELTMIPDTTPSITIYNTSEKVFRCVLRYLYGGGLPGQDFILSHGMEIIGIADQYEVTRMKLEIEALLVTSRVINAANVVEYLLFADGKNCALLKENAMSFLVARLDDVMAGDSYQQLQSSDKLISELLKFTKMSGRGTDTNDLKTLSVVALRQKLQHKYLNIDGSKEMLISRLEDFLNDDDVDSSIGADDEEIDIELV